MPEPQGKKALPGRAPGKGENAPGAPVLVVAADCPSAGAAFSLAERLVGLPVWIKVGLELFTAEGPSLVRRLAALPFGLFLDLKFHDIPHTVQGAVRSACALGARMLSLHTAGGEAMCRAAVAGRERALPCGGVSGRGPLLMGVTVLTSADGEGDALRDLVAQRAVLAKNCGLDGVVCSGREAEAVKRACGSSFLCVCPGIRFAGGSADDQSRVCSPGAATRAGADFLVLGRPITGAEDPAGAVRAAMAEIRTFLQMQGAQS
jgi:orotidine-5'-phosphate decarboxylase